MASVKLFLGITLLLLVNLLGNNDDLFLKSKFIVEGSATTHNWVLKSEVADVQAIAYIQNEQLFISKLKGVVPIFSLKGENPLMTIDAHEALMANQFPNISFELVKIIKTNHFSGDVLGLVLLEIAGQSQLLNFVVNTNVINEEFVQLKGWKTVRMSDFGVKAPTVLNGSVQAFDDIVIRFEMSIPLSLPESVQSSR